MIDRHARDIGADTLRKFMEGSISNREYERSYPTSKDDPVLWEICVQIWFLYSDLKTHTLAGRHALDQERRTFVERCVLFLKSDVEFQWPRQKFRPWRGILRILGFDRTVQRQERKEMGVGDKDVWPFLTKAEYENAVGKNKANPI